MFLIKYFNDAWEKERLKIEERLKCQLQNEIESLQASSAQPDVTAEQRNELQNFKVKLIFRKSMAAFESEEIARQRMQLRASYLAIVISSVALSISVVAMWLKSCS